MSEPESSSPGFATMQVQAGYTAGAAYNTAIPPIHQSGDAALDERRVEAVVDGLRTIKLVANIGDERSLVSHPASMTHSHTSSAQLAEAGISPTTIRLSVGLADPADVIADLARSLDAAFRSVPAASVSQLPERRLL